MLGTSFLTAFVLSTGVQTDISRSTAGTTSADILAPAQTQTTVSKAEVDAQHNATPLISKAPRAATTTMAAKTGSTIAAAATVERPSSGSTETTKLSFELARLGKVNVEGLSRRALTWMVVLVIVVVVLAGLAGKIAGDSGRRSAPVVTIGIIAAIAAAVVFLVMRFQLAPIRDVETTAVALRDGVQDVSSLLGRQDRRIHELESVLSNTNERLAALPTLQAELLTERNHLRKRERELVAKAADARAVQEQLKTTIALAERQREELFRQRHNTTAIWLAWSVFVLAILAVYHIFLWRALRRMPYQHIEDVVEHVMRRRGL